jgi:hypothetical protein
MLKTLPARSERGVVLLPEESFRLVLVDQPDVRQQELDSG